MSLMLAAPFFAQTPIPSQMSTPQMLRYYQQAKANRMSDMEIEQMVLACGFTLDDITKLRRQLEGVSSDGGNRVGDKRDTLGITRSRTRPTDEPEDQFQQYPEDRFGNTNQNRFRQNDKPQLSVKQKRTFGVPIFQNAYLDFSPNLRLAMSKNYVLVADDELIVDIYGNSVENFRLKVSPEGTVKMLNLASVFVSGLSIEAASERIVSRLRQAFSSLNRSGSGTYANITLGNIRTINVVVTGEVTRPSSYSVSSLSTAFNVLYASEGPTKNGSFCKIEVIRDINVVPKFDLYEFIVDANLKNNVTLQDQDIIMVYPYQTRVEIVGEVKRKGIFEASQSDTFQDLIRYAGRYTSKAYTAAIRYQRNTGKEFKVGLISPGQADEFAPMDGDLYEVGGILDRYENSISIEGAVYRPSLHAPEEGSLT